MRIALAVCGGWLMLMSAGVRADDLFAAADLPPEARAEIEATRAICRELYPDRQLYDGLEGIGFWKVKGLGRVVVIDNEGICGNVRTAGVNCTNRGCDLTIWQKRGAAWSKVFADHLYRKFISMLEDDRLVAIVASIYAGSPQCRPKKGVDYTSGRSCDVVIRYRGGRWHYELLR